MLGNRRLYNSGYDASIGENKNLSVLVREWPFDIYGGGGGSQYSGEANVFFFHKKTPY